ncbi:MAG: prenyltransferase [Comamonadaceae bacterium]|nr:prenyltransferase [Comamonadaceae bacterium]
MRSPAGLPGRPPHGAAFRPGPLGAWLAAVRPRSLLVAHQPGARRRDAGLRAHRRDRHASPRCSCSAPRCWCRSITNMQNDVGYTVRGGESSGTRTGLPRATANGWLQRARTCAPAIVVVALVATALGLRAGGATAAGRCWRSASPRSLAALAYMGGPRPIAYTPFGELTVFVFFGLVAVMGTGLGADGRGRRGHSVVAAGGHRQRWPRRRWPINNHARHRAATGVRRPQHLRGRASAQALSIPFVVVCLTLAIRN